MNRKSKNIEKKVWPKEFQLLWDGIKNFDFRLDNFDIQLGDRLLLKEWDPNTQKYTGRMVNKEVTNIWKTKENEWFTQAEIKKHGIQIMQLNNENIERPYNIITGSINSLESIISSTIYAAIGCGQRLNKIKDLNEGELTRVKEFDRDEYMFEVQKYIDQLTNNVKSLKKQTIGEDNKTDE